MNVPELARRLENLLMIGTVEVVDHAAELCRVRVGELLTAPVPWLAARAGAARTWWAPSVGEQVLLISPGGDLGRAIVLPGLYSGDHPAPGVAGDTAHITVYDDGAIVYYDPEQHLLTGKLPEGGKVQLAAPGGVEITGDVSITGKLHVSADVTLDAKASIAGNVDCASTVTGSTDVVGGGKSLKDHKHKGVTVGSGISGPPQ